MSPRHSLARIVRTFARKGTNEPLSPCRSPMAKGVHNLSVDVEKLSVDELDYLMSPLNDLWVGGSPRMSPSPRVKKVGGGEKLLLDLSFPCRTTQGNTRPPMTLGDSLLRPAGVLQACDISRKNGKGRFGTGVKNCPAFTIHGDDINNRVDEAHAGGDSTAQRPAPFIGKALRQRYVNGVEVA